MGEVYSGEGMYRRERSTFWVEKRNNKEVEKVNHNRRLRNSLNNRNGNHNSLGTRKSHRPDEKKKRVEFKKAGGLSAANAKISAPCGESLILRFSSVSHGFLL